MDGYISLGAEYFGQKPLDLSEASIRELVERNYQHEDYVRRLALVTEFNGFINRINIDDLVVALAEPGLAIGAVTSEATFDSETQQLVRSVEWADDQHSLKDLPSELSVDLEHQGRLVDISRSLQVLSVLADSAAANEVPDAKELTPASDVVLHEVSPTLADDLHLDTPWLQTLVHLLQDRRQIILYGPPGTGKTYVAQHLAKYLTRPDAVQLVQFHPSYAYEDFVEGFRPTASSADRVGFTLAAGPLRRIAALAESEPQTPHFLIIDEINRANLAKVFGELYFLLEYRESSINLQYSPGEPFALPRNLFIIGTMNTADRSIALVDAAIRRRFAFVEMHPDHDPVKSLLSRWLEAQGKTDDRRSELLAALNAAMLPEDHDLKIGPSYLMKADVDRPDGLDRAWAYSILPLLEEHYHGRLSRREIGERFGLTALRRQLDGAAEPEDS